LKLLDDVMVFNLDQHKIQDVNAGVVFVGYGITAPEFGWDDYAGAAVRGKVLLMLVNEPPSDDPNFFADKALTTTAAGPTSSSRRRAWEPRA
jgi:hypothetical protein